MLRRLPVHKVTDRSFAHQCLISQSNFGFFSFLFIYLLFKDNLSSGKKKEAKRNDALRI